MFLPAIKTKTVLVYTDGAKTGVHLQSLQLARSRAGQTLGLFWAYLKLGYKYLEGIR